MMKKLNRILIGLHLFIGIGAIFGGLGGILAPKSPMGMDPKTTLVNSPFEDFLIPGIILFTVIGLGNVFCAITAIKKSKYQAYFSGVISVGLMIWIIVQCIMMNTIVELHVIFFTLGFIGSILALFMAIKQKIYPINMILNYMENRK